MSNITYENGNLAEAGMPDAVAQTINEAELSGFMYPRVITAEGEAFTIVTAEESEGWAVVSQPNEVELRRRGTMPDSLQYPRVITAEGEAFTIVTAEEILWQVGSTFLNGRAGIKTSMPVALMDVRNGITYNVDFKPEASPFHDSKKVRHVLGKVRGQLGSDIVRIPVTLDCPSDVTGIATVKPKPKNARLN